LFSKNKNIIYKNSYSIISGFSGSTVVDVNVSLTYCITDEGVMISILLFSFVGVHNLLISIS